MFESRRPDTHLTGLAPTGTGATLYVGTRQTSSWSLRAWLAMDLARRPFDLVEVDLYQPNRSERIAAISPSGRVPVLVSGGTVIWDSLAIMEWAAEFAPELWPSHARRRAMARSVVAEMHAGFAALRAALPMDWFARYDAVRPLPAEAVRDLQRITGLWHALLSESGRGDFLFGTTPTLADVAYVPVASRLVTYGLVPEDPLLAGYVERLVTLPSLVRWFRGVSPTPALPEPPPIAVGDGPRPAPVMASATPAAAPPPAPAGPRRLEDVVARARGKGAGTIAAADRREEPPRPFAPRVPPPPIAPAPEPSIDPGTTDDDGRRGTGLPWLRRRPAEPEAPSGGAQRRRPPPRD
ncbi:MAG: glutathione S-transferase family protein [Pseudomonadota bacterium]